MCSVVKVDGILDAMEDIVLRVHENTRNHSCNVVVFPEAVLWGHALPNRTKVLQLSEPFHIGDNPCQRQKQEQHEQEAQRANAPVIQRRLSCLAQEYSMYLLASAVDRVPCDPSLAPSCPKGDRLFLFNAAVMFDPAGAILAKYHKSHIFGTSPAINQSPQPTPISFQLPALDLTLGLVCLCAVFVHVSVRVADGKEPCPPSNL